MELVEQICAFVYKKKAKHEVDQGSPLENVIADTMCHIAHEPKRKVELWTEDIGKLSGSLKALCVAPELLSKEQLRE